MNTTNYWMEQMGESQKPLSARVEERLMEKRLADNEEPSGDDDLSSRPTFYLLKVFYLADPLLPGEKLPSFELEGLDSFDSIKTYSLNDFVGYNTIFYFYQKDFDIETLEMLNMLSKLPSKQLDLKVISISTDSINTHQIWAKTSWNSKFPPITMLSDKVGDFSKLCGIYDAASHTSYNSLFLVDKNRTVQYCAVGGNGSFPLNKNQDFVSLLSSVFTYDKEIN